MFTPAHCSLYLLSSQKRARIKDPLLFCSFACILSHFSRVYHFVAPWTAARQNPRASPGKNAGVGCHALLQGVFPSQGLNPRLLHLQAGSLPAEPQGSPFFPSPCNKFSQDTRREEGEDGVVRPSPESEGSKAGDSRVAESDGRAERGRPGEKDEHHKLSLAGVFLKLMRT